VEQRLVVILPFTLLLGVEGLRPLFAVVAILIDLDLNLIIY
jgi:hypothetical protein